MGRNISNSAPAETAERFSALGGAFLTEPAALAARLSGVRGLVFDWDGVFNRGVKGSGAASTFSEADSMGTNMLRYGLGRSREALPASVIITGEANASAVLFAEREHFDAVYQGVRDKGLLVERLCGDYGLQRQELACVFDDINDLGMARGCAVRVLVRRHSSPLLQAFVVREAQCDYITAAEGDRHAVREAAEMLLGLMGAFDSVVRSRAGADDGYARYYAARQAVRTAVR